MQSNGSSHSSFRFFGKTCLNIDVFDGDGKRHTPREWFIVPLRVIEEAITLIVTGKIVDYTYDEVQECIVQK